jgi:alpha-D-ribose 1-methylphosphonate 5-triphosphate diphosphatase
MPDAAVGPLRRCLLTGMRTGPDRLLRFAVDAAGAVVPDPARRMPGRGLWLAPAPDAVATAAAKGLFARGARRKVRVPDDLARRTRQAWTAHAAAQLAAARRAGLVLAETAASGGTKVLTAEAAALGIGISEFPTTLTAARAARAHGLAVVAGAPNLVRGGSHSGNVAVATLLEAGVLDALASDYVPPAPLDAAFALARAGRPLAEAVALVSAHPARLVGLTDRGWLAPGLRADLVRVRLHDGQPVVRQVWRDGVIVA